jgi:hypothetical protein
MTKNFPGPIDWVMLAVWIATLILNAIVFGFAGAVVYLLLMVAAYRLGKALGR